MAGVIQKPDSLSLSGNIKKFILAGNQPVSFTLKKGDSVLLKSEYIPGADNLLEIDIRDVVVSSLAYKLDASNNFYLQTDLAASFTATIDGTDYSFRVIRGGVANLADTAAGWLKLHYLTWQPRVKPVTYYSPEWLTYYAVEECTAKLKATYPNKSTKVITLGTCVAGYATTMNLQYSVIAGLLGNTYPSYYEVWTEKAGGTKLSESQVYAFSDPLSEDEGWYFFENSLGGLDTFRAYGSNNLNAEHGHNIAEFGEVREEYEVDTERKYVKNTGYLDEYSRRWLLDFFPSRAKYVYEATAIRKIVVTESNVAYVLNELPSSYTFTWQMAEASSFLNLVKNSNDIPDNLIAPDLSSPDFILPPRLAEFPRITLSEGVLIPAFDPHNPIPTVTTYGAIHNTIKNAVVKELEEELSGIVGGGGGGGDCDLEIIKTNDLTLPTDKNVYSAARTDEEIGNIMVDVSKMFLRKDVPDRANKDIEFAENIIMVGGKDFSIYSNKQANSFNELGFRIWADGDAWLGNVYAKKNLMVKGDLSSPDFVSGFPAGIGWALTWREIVNAAGVAAKKTHLEIDDMTIRGILRVYEMVISQLLGENGTHLTTDMMKIKSIDRENRIVYLDTEEGLLYNPFWTDDILMVQRFNGMPTPENDYYVTKQYELVVEETHIGATDSEGNRLDWIKYKNFVGDEADIAIRDTLVRVDNLSNPDRKGIIKQTSVESGSPYMDIIYGMKTDTGNATKTRIGKLEGLITPYWGRLEKYGIVCDNLYAKGRFMLHTGEDVKTKFEIVEGRLESEMAAIRKEISDKDNVLSNASFASDMDKWETGNEVAFFTVARKFMFFNNGFYSDKRKLSAVVSSEGRKVLRLKKSRIIQQNEHLRYKPERQLELENGTFVWPTYYVSFMYRVKNAGSLTIGFTGQGLYHTVRLEESSTYMNLEVSGTWDGEGDFELSFSGDIEIYSLAMAANSLEDFKTEFLTRIVQTEKEILLHAQQVEKIGQRVTTTEGNISVMAGNINIWANRVTTVEGRMSSAEYSIINVIPDQISAVSSRVTVNDRGISNLWQAGFLTKTTAEGALAGIFASKNSVTAASIIATVNNAGQGTVKIKADRIELDGKTIIDIVEANDITTGRLSVTNGAKIGGFVIDSMDLYSRAGAGIAMTSGGRYCNLNFTSGHMIYVIGKTYNGVYTTSDTGHALYAEAGLSGYAISTFGNVQHILGGGSFSISGITRDNNAAEKYSGKCAISIIDGRKHIVLI